MKKIKLKEPGENQFFDWLNNAKDRSDWGAIVAIFRHLLFISTFAACMFSIALWLLKM